jgi:nucleoside-diphosphate-sugar epimerase
MASKTRAKQTGSNKATTDWRKRKLFVTGGSGHLGANLVRRLLEEGCQVRALVRRGSNNAALDGLDIELVWGDLRDRDSLTAALEGCSHVFHCAARLSTIPTSAAEEREIFASNVLGTRNLLEVAAEIGVERVVVTGSFSATGYDLDDPSRPAAETAPFYPFGELMPYEVSKAGVEHECLRAYANGMDVVVTTSCAILGPHDYKPSRMGRVLCDFARGKMRAFIPGGFEFVAARDIVQGHILAMDRGRSGQKYIFSTRYMPIDELMGYYEEVTGCPRPKLRLPPALMAGIAEVTSFVLTRFFPHTPQRLTPGAVRILRMQRHADISKAKDELGYQPTSILQAIHDAHADFVRRGVIPRTRPAVASGNLPDDKPSNEEQAARPSVDPPPTGSAGGNGVPKRKPEARGEVLGA